MKSDDEEDETVNWEEYHHMLENKQLDEWVSETYEKTSESNKYQKQNEEKS